MKNPTRLPIAVAGPTIRASGGVLRHIHVFGLTRLAEMLRPVAPLGPVA